MRDERGAALVWVVLCIFVLFGFAALVIDVGGLYVERRAMVTAADAAALAAAQELIYDIDNVEAVARDYAVQKNGSDPDKVTVEISDDHTTVTVLTGTVVKFTFARALGFADSNVSARAVARIGPLIAAGGIIPMTIPKDSYYHYIVAQGEGYGPVTLKFGNWKDGEIGPGNYNALALGGTGANTYRTNIEQGYSGTISIGDLLDTEPGNMSGPTNQGVLSRLNSNNPDDRIVLIPLYEQPVVDDKGKGTVKIAGFAVFELIGVEGSGNNSVVKGRFIKDIAQGDIAGEYDPSIDFGAYGIKLIE